LKCGVWETIKIYIFLSFLTAR